MNFGIVHRKCEMIELQYIVIIYGNVTSKTPAGRQATEGRFRDRAVERSRERSVERSREGCFSVGVCPDLLRL